MMKLQKEQQLILDTTNKDIIVSAGAGSGKTFVMIEKILKQIIDNRTPVTRLVVVTFTNAAASEMRQKLEKRLREYLDTLENTDDEYQFILQQINLLPQSNISTLHKFCQNIISKYFFVLNIDPSFNILEDVETTMLYNKALDDVLKEIEHTEQEGLIDLLYIYDNKRNNTKLRDMVLRVFLYLQNQTDIAEFKKQVLQSYDTDLDNNVFCQIIQDYIKDRCIYFENIFTEIQVSSKMQNCNKIEDAAKVCQNVAVLLKQAQTFGQLIHTLFNNIAELPRVPNVDSEFAELKERFSQSKNAFSEEIKAFKEKCVLDDTNILQEDLKHNGKIMQGIFALVEKFALRYDELKRKRNVVDFSDLEHMCMQILSNYDICKEVKSCYDYVFVDEYQDINDVQENIISRICTEGNLFLVGDVKQSIYGFRNTNPQIFLDKIKTFMQNTNTKSSILLNCNFRSDQRILDFVNLVFARLMTSQTSGVDYLTTSLMASDNEYLVSTALPCVEVDIVNTYTEDEEQSLIPQGVYSVKQAQTKTIEDKDAPKCEADIIADKIALLINQQKQIYDPKLGKDGGLRDIKFGDITILCRNRSTALQLLLSRLRDRGVPVEEFGQDDVFGTYEVQLLYNYLRLVNNYQDDIALTTILSSPVFNLTENQLYAIRQSAPDKKFFYECLDSVTDAQIVDKLNRLKNMLEESRVILINGTIYDCLNHFVQQNNLDAIVSLLPDGLNRVNNLSTFTNHFVLRSYNTNLSQFIEFVQSNDNTLSIPKDDNADSDVVHVTTMHHSKGLEYPIVFLVGLGEKFYKKNLQDEIVFYDQLGVGLYAYDYLNRIKRKTLSRSAVVLKLEERELAENLRLLYVAMTRAKNHLYVIGSLDINKFSPSLNKYDMTKANSFLELILSSLPEVNSILHTGLNSTIQAINPRNKTSKQMFDICVYPLAQHISKNSDLLTKPTKLKDYVPDFEQLLLDFANFSYPFEQSTAIGLKNSVTSLNKQEADSVTNVHEDTKQFGLAEQKGIQTSASLGTIYHKAMQLIDFNLDSVQEIYQFLSDKMDIDELKQLDCNKILVCLRQFRPLINDADQVLREQKFMMYVPHNLLTNSLITDKILVQGVVDLIVVKGDSAIIIDYKLSNVHNSKVLAEKYATQLHCYAMAVEKSLNKKIDKKILYSFLQEMQIIV